MFGHFKERLRGFRRLPVSLKAQTEKILQVTDDVRNLSLQMRQINDDVESLNEDVRNVSAQVQNVSAQVQQVSARFESAARLQLSAAQLTDDIIANWRRELAYQHHLLNGIRETQQSSVRLQQNLLDRTTHLNSRENSSFAYLGDHVGLAVINAGFRIFVDTRDRQIAPHLATVGVWEPWNTRLLRSLLKPGDVVVEVGANFGFFTILAATLVGEAGRVTTFEANPDLVTLLDATVEINGLTNLVDVRAMAATDSSGEVEFAIYNNYLGDGHIVSLCGIRHGDQKLVRVPAGTLDQQLPGVADVRLLRLDAEGAEPSILRGSRALIARSPRLVILTEWGLVRGGDTSELQELAMDGFTFHAVQHSGLLRQISLDELAHCSLCDIVCYRGNVEEFASADV
jgi:FkbM family methyltransferase